MNYAIALSQMVLSLLGAKREVGENPALYPQL